VVRGGGLVVLGPLVSDERRHKKGVDRLSVMWDIAHGEKAERENTAFIAKRNRQRRKTEGKRAR
jgi:hypothetical protein